MHGMIIVSFLTAILYHYDTDIYATADYTTGHIIGAGYRDSPFSGLFCNCGNYFGEFVGSLN